METPAVRTDFIPKQSQRPSFKKSSFSNPFFVIAIGIFFLVLFVWGGLTAYKYLLEQEKTQREATLTEQFEQNVDADLVNELETFDDKLQAVEDLLDNHTDIALLLDLIEQDTLTNSVRYSDFNYSVEDGNLVVTLSGEARSFASLGFQKKVLLENENVIDPVFSSFGINEEEGLVTFRLTYSIDPRVTSFGQNR